MSRRIAFHNFYFALPSVHTRFSLPFATCIYAAPCSKATMLSIMTSVTRRKARCNSSLTPVPVNAADKRITTVIGSSRRLLGQFCHSSNRDGHNRDQHGMEGRAENHQGNAGDHAAGERVDQPCLEVGAGEIHVGLDDDDQRNLQSRAATSPYRGSASRTVS
jgi:hypothetical protein